MVSSRTRRIAEPYNEEMNGDPRLLIKTSSLGRLTFCDSGGNLGSSYLANCWLQSGHWHVYGFSPANKFNNKENQKIPVVESWVKDILEGTQGVKQVVLLQVKCQIKPIAMVLNWPLEFLSIFMSDSQFKFYHPQDAWLNSLMSF